MAIEVKPLPKTVRKEMRRQRSPMRLAGPVAAKLAHVAMLLLTLAACGYGVYALWAAALEDPRFRMDGETLYLAGAVRECPESVPELETIGFRFNGRSLLDPRLIGDMDTAYGDSVWIKKVLRMRRRFPNRIEVEFLLRLPAAQVWDNGKFWLVDSDCTLLPVAGAETRFAALPEIVGVTPGVLTGRPGFGEEWRDEGVSGALGILRAFWGSPLAEVLPVEKIVVNAGSFRSDEGGRVAARKRFEVIGPGGAVVRWGTYNSGDLPGELTDAEKLWQLQELLRREDSLRAGVCFDVRTRLPGYSLIN